MSGTYVVASMLATVTGAVVASFFGVYGTLIGTAVISVASTVGAAVYQATLQSGKEQLREMGPVVASRARAYRVTYHSAVHGVRHGGPADSTIPGYGYLGDDGEDTDIRGWQPAWRDEATAAGDHGTRLLIDPGETETDGALNRVDSGEVDPGETAAEDAAHRGGASETAAETAGYRVGAGDTAAEPPAATNGARSGTDRGGDGSQDTAAGADHRTGGLAVRNLLDRIGWKRVTAIAAVAFVVAIGVVTVIELLVGKPLNAVVSGRHSSGTSVSNLFGGQPSNSPSAPQPSPGPASPNSTAPASPSAQPTQLSGSPRSTAPTPVPSPSPPAPSTIPGNGPPPSAPIPPANPPTGSARSASPNGQGTSAWGSQAP